ncbi:MAG TPA: hypothetical protein VGB78_00990 [Thermoplasmata archaeon]
MLTPTHLAFVVFLGLILALDKHEWFVAVMFGVFVDIDHVFGLQRYVEANGYSAIMAASWDDGTGEPWKSLMHYPVGVVIVAPLAIGWRFMLPLLFWGSHLGLDYLQTATLAHAAVVESIFLSAVIVGIFAVSFLSWRSTRSAGDVRQYLQYLGRSLRSMLYLDPA